MLLSHKLCRWLVPWAGVAITLSLVWLAGGNGWARWPLPFVVSGLLAAAAAWYWPEGRKMPLPIAWCGYLVTSNLAALQAWIGAVRGDLTPTWEPTRRPATEAKPR